MSEVLTINQNKKPIYDIVFTDSFNELPERLVSLGFQGRKVAVVTDTNVEPLYAAAVSEEVGKVCESSFIHAFPAGEANKTMDTVLGIVKDLVEHHFGRKDLVIALGGGVVGDVAGFAAAIFMRGIDVIQIPTTLLSQTDSSVGGKTGVDFDRYKNMIGAFKMPRLVYMNSRTLASLDARQFYSGMAEVLKYGLIMDASFYEWVLSKIYEIHERDSGTLSEMVKQSCACKQRIVERDPYEEGDRALLNFGHTIGHAIEKYKNFKLLHGECVALGCVAAAYMSWKREKLSMEEYYEIRDMFVPFQLPISVEDIDPEEILKLCKSDKKVSDGAIRFILLKKVGKAYIDSMTTDEEILAGIREIQYIEDNE